MADKVWKTTKDDLRDKTSKLVQKNVDKDLTDIYHGWERIENKRIRKILFNMSKNKSIKNLTYKKALKLFSGKLTFLILNMVLNYFDKGHSIDAAVKKTKNKVRKCLK